MLKILVVTGDGGEAYEALYAVHRLREAGCHPVVAAPSVRRLHLVMHDFEPGWDTYIERQGYGLASDVAINDVDPTAFEAVLLLGGRAPEYLRNNPRLVQLVQEFDRAEQVDFCDLPRCTDPCHGRAHRWEKGARAMNTFGPRQSSQAQPGSLNRLCATAGS